MSSVICERILGKKGNIWAFQGYLGMFGIMFASVGFVANQEYEAINYYEDK